MIEIRLHTLSRELNLGINTITEFLEENGLPIKDTDSNPKITYEQYKMIVKKFVKVTKLFTFFWKENVFTNDPEMNREIINSHGWNRMRDDTIIIFPSKYILIPRNQNTEKFAYWTKADFESKCQNAFENNMIIKEHLAEPSGFIPVTPYEEERKIIQNKVEQKIFSIKQKPSVINIPVMGKIDLDELNASRIHKRKSKQDRTKEPNEHKNRRKLNNQENEKEEHVELKSCQNNIKDIWQRFVDIQEELIKQRSSPISIIPDSIEVDNDKLYVTVDESGNEKRIDSILKGKLGADTYDLESGYVLVDENLWDKITEDELIQIRKSLSECYVELDTTPAINVTISYGGNMNRSDQLSIKELKQMESVLKNGTLIEGFIDDKAAFISKVLVQREEYMKYLFGKHYITYEKKNKEHQQIIELLEYHNQYIPWDILQQYSHLGLACKYYKIIFKINNLEANEELRDCYDCYFPNTNTFEFCRSFTKEDPCYKDYICEVNDNISAFMDEATIYCSKNDIDIKVDFVYTVSKHQIIKTKLKEVGQFIKMKGDGFSFNDETGAIGIDFNWRTDDINDLLSEIEHEIPFVKVNVYDEHKFKCKVNSKLVGYEELKKALKSKYKDIDIRNDSTYQQIKIRLPYIEPDYYEIMRTNLENDLFQLNETGINVEFSKKTENKIRLNVTYNKKSRLEDLEDNIKELRSSDFGFLLANQEIPFGKLLKTNYPDLIFDIDVEDEKKESIIKAFESKAINTIIPILTGDLEKISRLKNTFTMATTGEELVNPHLQRFIFDSSEATKTQDIDVILRKDGSVYKDICSHLLNPKVNESQKDAIIKAIYAEDLAVIQGPPGTGKSTAIAEMIWQLVRKGLQQGNKRERILLTSETNLAVDNAISKIVNNITNLVKPVRFGDEGKLESEGLQFSIELMKDWVEEGDSCLYKTENDEEIDSSIQKNLILKNWLSNISSRSFNKTDYDNDDIINRWHLYLNHPNKTLRQIIYNRYIENANVIGATCSSIGDKRSGSEEFNGFTPFFHNFCDVFKQKIGRAKIRFTTVIQDESSKATPAELVLPFVYGERAIVIGDHRQLPPMLDKEEFENALEYADEISKDDKDREEVRKLQEFVEEHFEKMEESHFQRLYENIDSSLKGTFNLQYRMHPDINQVIEQFYREDGGLYCGLTSPIDLGVNDSDMNNPASRYHGLDIPGLINHNTHVLFIDSTSPEMMDGHSRVNYGEISTIDKLLTRFETSNSFHRYLNKFTKEEDKQIGIISFYGKQIRQLKCVAHDHPNLPIRVSTVDRFQGMERNIVIVSMVRSNTIQGSKNQEPDWKRYPELGYSKQESLGFAQSPNRLNVALSRAKRLLIIIGNRQLFSTLEIYNRLFLTIEANNNNKIVNQEEV